MKSISNFFTRFWSTDNSLSAVLIFLFMVIFVFYPLYDIPLFKFITKILFLLIVVSGCTMVLRRRLFGIGILLLVVVYILLNWGEIITESASVSFWNCLVCFFCCGLLVVIILVQIFKEERITANHIQSAVAVYLLLGLMWGFLYQAIALKVPGAFLRTSLPMPDTVDALKKDLIYYSFITLTTLGYGDIMPVHSSARMLATLEALMGQLFPAILIARLVSIHILHSERK
jgi:hypothetical protein